MIVPASYGTISSLTATNPTYRRNSQSASGKLRLSERTLVIAAHLLPLTGTDTVLTRTGTDTAAVPVTEQRALRNSRIEVLCNPVCKQSSGQNIHSAAWSRFRNIFNPVEMFIICNYGKIFSQPPNLEIAFKPSVDWEGRTSMRKSTYAFPKNFQLARWFKIHRRS
ncbi:hypothetical protein B0H17DRAFT_1138344 [Mycena rosella]|uniref:Uncharacterized protein n=1 Tax=Mycena rosella TaxID=1033263 RepID=A0AAD7D6J5_MYCRO|nr:hypothetical protein B0H17DRAFT_1138344 [Mycena rosella]